LDEKMVRDPVCFMDIPSGAAQHLSKYRDKFYYFCSRACKVAFDKNPETYLKRRGGWWVRFIERLAKSSRDSFGTTPPKCH